MTKLRKLLSSRLNVGIVLGVLGGGVALGLQAASGRGVIVLAVVVAILVFVFVLSRSLGHLIGMLIGWLPFVGGITVVDFGSLPDITVGRVALVVAIVLCLQRSFADQADGIMPSRYLRTISWAVVLALPLLIQAAARSFEIGNALRHLLDSYLIPLLCFIAVGSVSWSDSELDGAMRLMLTGGMGWTIIAVVEFFTGRSLYAGIDYAALGRAYIRPAGPFSSPTALGWAAGALAVAGFAWYLGRRGGRVGAVGTASAVAATAITLTRSSWLGVAAAFVYVIPRLGIKSRWRVASLVVLGGVAAWILLGTINPQALTERAGNEGTIFNRLSIYATAWSLVLANPVFGVGLTMFKNVSQSALIGFGDISASYGADVLAPHNTALLVAVEAGLIAAAILGWAMTAIVKGALEAVRGDAGRHWVKYALVSVITVSVVNGVAMDLQLHAQAAYVVCLLTGMLFGAACRPLLASGVS